MLLSEVKKNYASGFYKNYLKLSSGDTEIIILEVIYQFANNRVIGFTRKKNQLADWFEAKLYYKAQKEPRFNVKGRTYKLADFKKPKLVMPFQPTVANIQREVIKRARQFGSGF